MYMSLSFRHNCKCCSVATARMHVFSDPLNQAFSVHLCEYSHRNSAKVHISNIPCPLQKWYTRCKFYVGVTLWHKLLTLTFS